MRVFDSQEELTVRVLEEDTDFMSRNEEWIRGYDVLKCVVKHWSLAHEPEQQSGLNEMNVLNSPKVKVITYKGADRKVRDMSKLMLSFLPYNDREATAK
ncbi:hypothetical protein V6N13_110663 [Hibiscus sabdariffa]